MRRPTFRHLRRLLESRALSGDAMVALQTEKLRRVLAQAQAHVPWYRDVMANLGCDASGDDPWQVLAAMPLVARGDLQKHLDRFVAEGAGHLVSRCTSGSTGVPLRFYLDRRRMAADKAARFCAQLEWNIGIGDRKVWLWGRPASPSLGDRLKSLRDRLMNERVLCAYDMSPETMRRQVDVLRRWRPRSVTCYPSAAWRLCRFALDEGLDLRASGVGVWFTTGEMLQEHHRRTIEEASGGRVANEYGLREAGFVAHACRRGTMHVTAENVFVETIRRDGTSAGDAMGEIVVTNLDALGMPLVRYRTGDYGRVTRRDCACGRQTQCLDDLSGRQSDFLVAADGTPTVGFALSRRFWDVPGVRQFRVVQESLSQTRVIVVPGDGFDDTARGAVAEIIRDVLGPSVQVAVETSAAIPSASSGKTATFQSRIATEYL